MAMASPTQSLTKIETGTHDVQRRESNVDTGKGEKTVEDAFRNLENDTMKDPVTGFTGHEKMMIWESWKRMKRVDFVDSGAPPFNIHFVLWLFENVPGMRDRFDKFDANQKDQELLIGDEMFVAHAQVLTGELYAIIKLLPEPEELMSRISKLTETHVKMTPRVGEKYFQSLHDKIHLFVRKRLDVRTDDEVVQLWTKLFGLILEKAKAAEAKAGPQLEDKNLKKEKQQKGCCLIL